MVECSREQLIAYVARNYRLAQVTEDLNTRKVLQTRETIITFTGRPPKDASHIEELKHVIETFPHPNLDNVGGNQDTRGTIPVDCNVWDKLTDWPALTTEQKNETKEFLLTRFSVDDLQLAWEEYYTQNGEIPNSVQYRIFINNWRGNKTKRRTQSLAEMVRTIEQKDDEIHRERDEHYLVKSQMDLITHIYNGQIRRVQDLEEENNILRDNVHQLEIEVEEHEQDNNHLREINGVQGRHVYQLRRTITEKDRQLCEKCSRLRELEDVKDEHVSVIKRQRLMIKEKKEEVKEQIATINELNVKNNELNVKNNELNVENNEQSATINEQSATINELQVENNEQSSTINEQSATINELQVENNEQSATINEQSATINEQSATINEQSDTINELQVENNEQSATINEQSATIGDLIEQNHDRCKTINELNSKVKIEVYRSRTKEEIIAEQSQIIEEQKAQIEELREKVIKYQSSDSELREELEKQDKINQDLYDQLDDLKQLCNKLMQIQAKGQRS